MVLIKIITIIVSLAIPSFANEDTRFQQYTQEFSKPPVYYYNYFPIGFGRINYHHYNYFNSFSFENLDKRKRYIESIDKNTYTSPNEYKILDKN